jgi:hypothetical protein
MNYTVVEIAEILRLHAMWLRGEDGGQRADLRGANLRGANLSFADLRNAFLRYANLRGADLLDANLRGADLRGADLRYADLRYADLRGTNLRDADLRGADLRGANLRDAELPDSYRIASLCFGGWPITVTPERTSIGCQTYPNEDWLRWTPEDVAHMERRAEAWWTQHRESVCAVIRDVMGDKQ